jgi:hypothetical protein
MNVIIKALIAGLFFCAAACFSQIGSAAKPDTVAEKVLISSGNSYMEKAVSSIVKDSLAARGYTVDIVSKRNLNSQDRRNYRVIILFGAVRAADLSEAAKRFVRSLEGTGSASNLLICTIYGERWDTEKQDVNAVASATKTLKPDVVAGKILSNFNAIAGK